MPFVPHPEMACESYVLDTDNIGALRGTYQEREIFFIVIFYTVAHNSHKNSGS